MIQQIFSFVKRFHRNAALFSERSPLLMAFSALVFFCAVFSGCSEESSKKSQSDAPPTMKAAAAEPRPITIRELRKKLKVNELANFEKVGNDIVGAELYRSGVKDISPLKGLPLRRLDLGATEVKDISPLVGMPLTHLNLEATQIEDLSPLKEMQLTELYLQDSSLTDLSILKEMPLQRLNLKGSPVTSIEACAGMPLQTLWILETGVSDLSPLNGKSLVSLDIQSTNVSDLSPLAGMTTMQRINIIDTKVTDVSPLAGMPLQRISLTPENITDGMEVLRKMPTLNQILTTPVGVSRQSAAEFWAKYDAGVYSSVQPQEDAENTEESPAGSTGNGKSDVSDSDAVEQQSSAEAEEMKQSKSATAEKDEQKSSSDESPK